MVYRRFRKRRYKRGRTLLGLYRRLKLGALRKKICGQALTGGGTGFVPTGTPATTARLLGDQLLSNTQANSWNYFDNGTSSEATKSGRYAFAQSMWMHWRVFRTSADTKVENYGIRVMVVQRKWDKPVLAVADFPSFDGRYRDNFRDTYKVLYNRVHRFGRGFYPHGQNTSDDIFMKFRCPARLDFKVTGDTSSVANYQNLPQRGGNVELYFILPVDTSPAGQVTMTLIDWTYWYRDNAA